MTDTGGNEPSDRLWMAQALALATLGEGRTSPNPRVGCVVVRDGAVVGSGFHPAVGEPHAEWFALAQAGDRARGGTLYVNLEPCSHQGRTPPCTDLVIRSGVRRVVASLVDPNPLVNGRGIGALRAAGIRVDLGVLSREAEALNAGFIHLHRTGRPLVTLKAAISLDGRLAVAGGVSRWITGEPARRHARRLRLRHDAVLVGAGTVRRDDPLLTVRLPGVRAPRIRAVLAPRLDIQDSARVLDAASDGSPPPRLYASDRAPEDAERVLASRATIVRVGEGAAGLDLGAVLDDLARAGAQSVLVEGGGRTLGRFLEAGLADRAAFFVASTLLGDDGATPLATGFRTSDPNRAWRLEDMRRVPLGPDLLIIGRPSVPAGGAP